MLSDLFLAIVHPLSFSPFRDPLFTLFNSPLIRFSSLIFFLRLKQKSPCLYLPLSFLLIHNICFTPYIFICLSLFFLNART